MQCQNCHYYLDNDCRYCPRCGAPTSLGWPTAGGPWLRRPAAIGALALLLMAWLVALQRALWLPPHLAAAVPPPPDSAAQTAAVPSVSVPSAPPPPISRDRRSVVAMAPHPSFPVPPEAWRSPAAIHPSSGTSVRDRLSRRMAARGAAQARDRVPGPPAADVVRPRPRSRETYSLRLTGTGPLPSPELIPRWQRRRSSSDSGRPAGEHNMHARGTNRGPWSQPPVPARFPMEPPHRVAVRPSDLVVNVSARPYGLKTFVYLNAGRMLGISPLPVRFDRPGRYKLLFWTPALRRHLTRVVDVTGRGRQWVSATMGPSRELARLR